MEVFNMLTIFRYGDGVEGFYNYLWQVHGTYPNISLWVTEFASTSLNATGEFDD